MEGGRRRQFRAGLCAGLGIEAQGIMIQFVAELGSAVLLLEKAVVNLTDTD